MAIYQFNEEEKKQSFTETFEKADADGDKSGRRALFSTLVTRFCFLLLLVADSAWLLYNTAMLTLSAIAYLVTGGKNRVVKRLFHRFSLHFRRSAVCALALMVGLFSPPFGIMIACTYFLMYDKAGMEEVVPATLQAQMKDIFRTDP